MGAAHTHYILVVMNGIVGVTFRRPHIIASQTINFSLFTITYSLAHQVVKFPPFTPTEHRERVKKFSTLKV